MSDPVVEAVAKSYEFIVAGVVAVVGWVAKRTVHRVDALETQVKETREDYVKKRDFNDTVNSLRQEIRQGHEQISKQITDANRQHQSRLDDLFSVLLAKADERIARESRRNDDS